MTSSNRDISGRGVAGAAGAMTLVGTLAAVSATIGRYPVYGGQAVRYAIAAVILLLLLRIGDRRRTTGRRRRHRGATTGSRPAAVRAGRPGRHRLERGDILRLCALSATGLAGFNVCVVEATRHAGPATVGTVVGAVPVVLALAAPMSGGTAGRRGPAPRIVAAGVIVALGAACATGLGGGSLPGLLFSLGALAGEAGFSLLAVPLLPRLGPVRVSAYAAAGAVPMLVLAGLIAHGRGLVRMPTAAEAAALAYLTVIVTVVAFFLWYDAMPRLGADRAGLFAGLIPVSAALTAFALGRGTPRPADLAGAALVAAGVTVGLAPRGRRSRAAGGENRAATGAAGREKATVPGAATEAARAAVEPA